MSTLSMTKTTTPEWLLTFWKEIDDQTFGEGFNCLAEDATCSLGVAEWRGREAIRENLRAFIDTGFTALHDVVEFWDGGWLKVFRSVVTMAPNGEGGPVVKPVMTHFFYMDENDPAKSAQVDWRGGSGCVLVAQQTLGQRLGMHAGTV